MDRAEDDDRHIGRRQTTTDDDRRLGDSRERRRGSDTHARDLSFPINGKQIMARLTMHHAALVDSYCSHYLDYDLITISTLCTV